MIRVLLVDDQTLVRQGIQVLLDGVTDIDVIGEASNGREAIALTRQLQPHIVLMDIRMPEVDGVEATRQIIEDYPDTGVIILTTFDDDEYVFEGLKVGARGYLLKDIESDEMVKAIQIVAGGNALIQPSIAQKVVAEFARLATHATPNQAHLDEALSERELEVLKHIADGLSNKEIAAKLVISLGTVKRHITNMYGKLDVQSRTQAIAKATTLNLFRR